MNSNLVRPHRDADTQSPTRPPGSHRPTPTRARGARPGPHRQLVPTGLWPRATAA